MKRLHLTLLVVLLGLCHVGAQEPMVLLYNTHFSDGTTVALPLSGTVNVSVDWGMAPPMTSPQKGFKSTSTNRTADTQYPLPAT